MYGKTRMLENIALLLLVIGGLVAVYHLVHRVGTTIEATSKAIAGA